MNAPRYIQKELNLINPLYFSVHDPRPRLSYRLEDEKYVIDTQGRWHVRKWKSIHPINQRIETWMFNSVPILIVHQSSPDAKDIGYMDIDMRVIHRIREGLWNALNYKKLLAKIDQSNDDLQAKAEAEEEYIHRYGAKAIWRHYQEPTIFLGG